MRSPATAMAWQLWRRYRWLAAAGAVWLVTASIVCRLLPVGVHNDVVVFLTVVPMLLLLGWQVAVFTYGSDADLSNKESGYPAWMLRHPVSVRLLVGWPMFLGAVIVPAVWTAIAWGIFHGRGVDVAILRPALISVAVLAWSQALIWSPFGWGWLRVIAVVGVILMVIFIALLDVVCGVPNMVILSLLAAQLPAAYCAAIAGVSRARRGDDPEWRWLPILAERVVGWIPRRGRPFASPLRAQAWFEWRRHGMGPPLMVGILAPMAVAFILVNQMNPRLPDDSPLASPLALLLLAAFLTVGMGADFGSLASTKTDRGMPGFLFVRPISGIQLIGAKYLAAAKSSAAVCLITALAVALCMLLTGRFSDINVLRGLLENDSWWTHPVVLIPAAFLLLWVFGWLGIIQGLCVGLTGRQWVAILGVGTVGGVAVVVCMLLGLWLSIHPEYYQACWNALPWLVAALVPMKLTLATYILLRACGSGLLETRAVMILVVVWATVVLATIGLSAWLVPSDALPPGLLAGGMILTLPLTRLALAPLALAWNRHR